VKEKLHIINEFIFICKRKVRFKDQCSLEHWQFIDGRSRCKYFRSSESDQYIISLQRTAAAAHQKKKKRLK